LINCQQREIAHQGIETGEFTKRPVPERAFFATKKLFETLRSRGKTAKNMRWNLTAGSLPTTLPADVCGMFREDCGQPWKKSCALGCVVDCFADKPYHFGVLGVFKTQRTQRQGGTKHESFHYLLRALKLSSPGHQSGGRYIKGVQGRGRTHQRKRGGIWCGGGWPPRIFEAQGGALSHKRRGAWKTPKLTVKPVSFNMETLALWARSEKNGSAVLPQIRRTLPSLQRSNTPSFPGPFRSRQTKSPSGL